LLASKEDALPLPIKERNIYECMNNYTKPLTNLSNIDEVLKNEDKMLILLSSLPDKEYETLVLTLINGKFSLSNNNILAALANLNVRRKDKASISCSTTTEVLTIREIVSIHRKGKRYVSKSKTCNR